MDNVLAINGGTPVRKKKWPSYEDGFKTPMYESLSKVIESGRFFRYDDRPIEETFTGKFENAIRELFNVKYALAVSSGTAALSLALMALDLPDDSYVACPAFGFPATVSAVILAKKKPLLFAVDNNLNFDLEDLKNRWDDRIKCIIVVHMRGVASSVSKIVDFAKSKGVEVIEDAIPSLGLSIEKKYLGTYGKIGCFSTQSDKTINTGEGGFIVTDDRCVYEKMVLLSGAYEGRYNKHIPNFEFVSCEYNYPLYNFRMDEIRASIAFEQIGVIKEKVQTIKDNYNYVISKIEKLEGLRIRKSDIIEGVLGDSLVFFVQKSLANKVVEALNSEGISTRCFGDRNYPNVRSFSQWKFLDEVKHELPKYLEGTINYFETSVDISLSVKLEKKDLDDLIKAINKVINYYCVK